jgi:predicted RNase H-like nuclease (RuvC/YqgF family)
MKKTMLTLTLATFMLAGTTAWTSCSSPAQKEENAKEEVVDAQQDLNEAKQDAATATAQAATAEEWEAFKNETKSKIDANQALIGELRKRKRKADNEMTEDAYKAKIDELQEHNKQLRDRLDAYESNKSDWGTFRSQYNADMDELNRSLNDLNK